MLWKFQSKLDKQENEIRILKSIKEFSICSLFTDMCRSSNLANNGQEMTLCNSLNMQTLLPLYQRQNELYENDTQ